MTVDEAAGLPEVKQIFRDYVLDQEKWGAEAEALTRLFAVLPAFGPERSWHIGDLGKRALVKVDGEWRLRQVA